MVEKLEIKMVIDFFYEHPIKDFTSKQIAEYLKMNEDDVEKILEIMFTKNKLDKIVHYKASSSFIKEIIIKMNKQYKDDVEI